MGAETPDEIPVIDAIGGLQLSRTDRLLEAIDDSIKEHGIELPYSAPSSGSQTPTTAEPDILSRIDKVLRDRESF